MLSSAPRQQQEGNSRHFVPIDSLEGRLELSIYTCVHLHSPEATTILAPFPLLLQPLPLSEICHFSELSLKLFLGPLPLQCLHLHFSISSALLVL